MFSFSLNNKYSLLFSYYYRKESKVRFHHTSVLNTVSTMTQRRSNHSQCKKTISDLPCDWLLYEEMMRTGSTAHAYCCSLITPLTVALFSGPARLPLDAIHEPNQGTSYSLKVCCLL